MGTVHAEIEYLKEDGTGVHSDICPPGCSSDNLKNKDYRKYLHACLDEWLDNSRGTCGFCIKEESYHFDFHYGDDV